MYKANKPAVAVMERIESMILTIRAQRVMTPYRVKMKSKKRF